MKIEQILIYDSLEKSLFYPFSILHPIWELRVGALKLYEKYEILFPDSNILFYSNNKLILENFFNKINNKNIISKKNTLICPANLNINSNFISTIYQIYKNKNDINEKSKSIVFNINHIPIIAYIGEDEINFGIEDFDFEAIINKISCKVDLSIDNDNLILIDNLWELIDLNGEIIRQDFTLFKNYKELKQEEFNNIAKFGTNKVLIGENVIIEPFCYFNTEAGGIIIDDNAIIKSHSMIQGPCYIGKNTMIKSGAKIYENSSIGEYCKIGGEIENSIFQSYSNKQHDGFLGHSFISEWVNLGAGTNNSDLKNNYSKIKINIEDKEISTNKMFFGMLMGDHSKSAIGSRFNTGTVIGICSSIFNNGFPPKRIKSFSFGGDLNSNIYDFEKSIEVARKVMLRRNKDLLESEIILMKKEFQRNIENS